MAVQGRLRELDTIQHYRCDCCHMHDFGAFSVYYLCGTDKSEEDFKPGLRHICIGLLYNAWCSDTELGTGLLC